MLPKKERLNRATFSRFFSAGKRIHSPSLQLVFTPYASLHASVVVPKKIVKSAVGRNKLRRQIYDMVRRYRSEGPLSGVYIFLIKPNAVGKKFTALQEEVVSCIQKANT